MIVYQNTTSEGNRKGHKGKTRNERKDGCRHQNKLGISLNFSLFASFAVPFASFAAPFKLKIAAIKFSLENRIAVLTK